jgi:CheY-like chemotaxis protein
MEENKIKVLIVDDEKVVRSFLHRLLIRQGVDVMCAEDGYKAIELCKGLQFDILFVDVRMPGLDGLETYRQIRRLLSKAVIVMMTGYAHEETLQQARHEGVYAAIHKPFELNEIKAILDKFVSAPKEIILNIMVIDDDETILEFFSKLLKSRGQRCVAVDNGEEALHALKREKFDLIFLDLVLRDIDGVQIHNAIREVSPDTVVILITAYPQKVAEIEGKVYGCLLKPFEISHILEYIEKIKHKSGVG